MTRKVDLYDNAYGKYALDVYRQVRIESYGEDLGQTSWVTREEADEIPRLLELTRESVVLELGCGSGRYALRLAEKVGCAITGVDLNENGVRNANDLVKDTNLASRVRFETGDASRKLRFQDGAFDAIYANDVICHIPGRTNVFEEVLRLLKPGGRFLFSDALVIGGVVSHEEIATRSSIGYYLFSPPGENERLLQAVGFRAVVVRDTTGNAAEIAEKWMRSREKSKDKLSEIEGSENFEGVQKFLSCVHRLTAERRLRRYLYVLAKE
jgi:ubiquinone/menaquinone biosynthesis C-methylase UbiE